MMEMEWFAKSECSQDPNYHALVIYDEDYGDNYRQRIFRLITTYEELNVDGEKSDSWICMRDVDSILGFNFSKYCKDNGLNINSDDIIQDLSHNFDSGAKYLLYRSYAKLFSHILMHEPKGEIRNKVYYLLYTLIAIPFNIEVTKHKVLQPDTKKSKDAKEVRAHDNISIKWDGRPIDHELEAIYGIIASGFANFELNNGTPSVQNGAISIHVLYNSDSKYGYDIYCQSGLIKYIEHRAPKGIKELPVIKTFGAYRKDYGIEEFYNIDDAIRFLNDDDKTNAVIYELLCNIRYEWNVKEVIGKLRNSADEYFNDHYEDIGKD